MKYMGSKQYMLKNGLAELLNQEVPSANRFIDPFAGSGAVAFYVAKNFPKKVILSDTQSYSAAIGGAVLGNLGEIDIYPLKLKWIDPSKNSVAKSKKYLSIKDISNAADITSFVSAARKNCEQKSQIGPVWNAYGGHYFSPEQALAIDYLLKNLPEEEQSKRIALAALIRSASKLASAPGHTAQPLQPKLDGNVNKLILSAWKRDIFDQVWNELEKLNSEVVQKEGECHVLDVNETIEKIVKKGDLVFLDPPYSGVQYSRFYHVLETIARGYCGPVEGVGRYPALSERPQSKFSNVGQSKLALEDMLYKLSEKQATVIFTFPAGKCSNGLSGKDIRSVAKKYFDIEDERHHVHGSFSTMGGNNKNRPHKIDSNELLLLLRPKFKSIKKEVAPLKPV